MPDEEGTWSEAEKLLGAFRRVMAVLRRDPEFNTEELAKVQDGWLEVVRAMREILGPPTDSLRR